MNVGIKVTYQGKPLWQVGCLRTHIDARLRDIRIAGKQAIEKAVSYVLIPADSMLEARALAVAKVMTEPREGDITLAVEPYNTHEWHGEPNDAEAAKRSYGRYLANEVH